MSAKCSLPKAAASNTCAAQPLFASLVHRSRRHNRGTLSKRVVIGTAATIEMGRIYEQMFRQAGIPVTAMMSSAGVEFYTPGSPAELWLEDDTLLEDVEVRQ